MFAEPLCQISWIGTCVAHFRGSPLVLNPQDVLAADVYGVDHNLSFLILRRNGYSKFVVLAEDCLEIAASRLQRLGYEIETFLYLLVLLKLEHLLEEVSLGTLARLAVAVRRKSQITFRLGSPCACLWGSRSSRS